MTTQTFVKEKYKRYTKEILEPVVKISINYSEVCRKLGQNPRGAMWQLIKARINQFGIDTSHFLGNASHTGVRHTGRAKTRTPDEVLIRGKKQRENSRSLRMALIAKGRTYCCQKCNNGDTWFGDKITLHIDHINWDWSDCREENLQFLCPNCHSQRRKRKKCGNCDKLIKLKQTYCKKCVSKIVVKRKMKIDWLPTEKLIELVKNTSYCAVARILGVSDNAIRKRIKNHPPV